MTKFVKGFPVLIEKASAESIAIYPMCGRGATAPGAITLRRILSEGPRFVIYFTNTQSGGNSGGLYCETLAQAYTAFAERIQQWDLYGDLNAAHESGEGDYRYFFTKGDDFHEVEIDTPSHVEAMAAANQHFDHSNERGAWKASPSPAPCYFTWTSETVEA